MVLEVTARKGSMGARILEFKQLQGDFEKYEGAWIVEPGKAISLSRVDCVVIVHFSQRLYEHTCFCVHEYG